MTQKLLFPSWVKTCSWRNNRDRLPTWNFNLQNGNTKSVLSFSQKQTTKKESLHWFERDHLILYLQLMDEQTFWYLQDSRNINQYARLDSERDELARRKLTLDRRSKVGEGEEFVKLPETSRWAHVDFALVSAFRNLRSLTSAATAVAHDEFLLWFLELRAENGIWIAGILVSRFLGKRARHRWFRRTVSSDQTEKTLTWVPGGGADRTFDDFEGSFEHIRQSKGIVDPARLNLAVDRQRRKQERRRERKEREKKKKKKK